MHRSNSATIRNCGASLSSSRGVAIVLWSAPLHMKHDSLECVRRCRLFERNVSALMVCRRISGATEPSHMRCTRSLGSKNPPPGVISGEWCRSHSSAFDPFRKICSQSRTPGGQAVVIIVPVCNFAGSSTHNPRYRDRHSSGEACV